MSDCCATKPATAPGESSSAECPVCGKKGARVDSVTLKALLTGEGLRRGVPPSPRFCATIGCPVVYFDNNVPIRFEEELLVSRVHAKHPEEERTPVCYCFGYTPRTIRDLVASSGPSSASVDIAREMKAGRCACEVKNPKGSCCPGDVTRVERALLGAARTTR